MRNLPFVLWMLLWPLSYDLSDYLDWLAGRHYTADVRGLSALATLIIWAYVGSLLYEGKPR